MSKIDAACWWPQLVGSRKRLLLEASCKDDTGKRGKTSPLSAFHMGAEKVKGKSREVISACVQLPPCH